MLWIGPAFTVGEALTSPALAPAASRWQEGLLTAIAREGTAIQILTHRAERIWPFGQSLVGTGRGLFHGLQREEVPFANLPAMRGPTLTRAYSNAIDRLCADDSKPDLIASYNIWSPVAAACRHATEQHGVPWIPFLLDHNRPTADWGNVMPGLRGAAGVVFVSHWAYETAPLQAKFHLDGGVATIVEAPPKPHRSGMLLYTGALHKWGGIEVLLDSMPLVKTPNVRLVVVGRGGCKQTMQRLARTTGVQYLGGVDEPLLHALTKEADVLANPRPSHVQGNEMNFPSKLLQYLSSLKPVATTLTPGVAPEYRDVVIAAADDSPKAFADAIDHAFSLDDTDTKALAYRIRAFLEGGRLWPQQSRRFLEWADQVITADKQQNSRGSAL